MDISEKLTKIAEKEAENIELNESLEQTLYGTNMGGKSAYDAFWDSYQDNGDRTLYNYAFAHWTEDNFNPKYNMVPTGATYMFNNFNARRGDAALVSLPEMLKKANIALDCKNVIGNGFQYFGSYSKITDFGFIDCSGASGLNYMFNYANRMTNVSLKIKEDGSQTFTNTFDNCTRLVNFEITEGTIGKGISFSASPLNKKSIESIINHLSSTTGVTLILKKSAVDTAFQTADGANDGSNSDDWIDLIKDKSNDYNGLWTISLV